MEIRKEEGIILRRKTFTCEQDPDSPPMTHFPHIYIPLSYLKIHLKRLLIYDPKKRTKLLFPYIGSSFPYASYALIDAYE